MSQRKILISIPMLFMLMTALISGSWVAAAATPTPTAVPTLTPTATLPPLRNNNYLHDTSLSDDNSNCSPPCWHGIIPGHTLWEDALKRLQDDPNLENVTVQNDPNSTALFISFQQKGGMTCCRVIVDDGKSVNEIFLLLASDVLLNQLITAWGKPTYVVGSPVSSNEAAIDLVYPYRSMVVYVFVAGTHASISARSEVIGVLYMRPTDMDLLLSTSSLFTWKGYQSYEAYSEGPFDVTPRVTLTPTPHP